MTIAKRCCCGFVALLLATNLGCQRSPSLPNSKVVDLRYSHRQRCPVHDRELIEATQEIDDAHISWEGHYLQARGREFPLASGDITDCEASLALIWFCPECGSAKAKWSRDNQ